MDRLAFNAGALNGRATVRWIVAATVAAVAGASGAVHANTKFAAGAHGSANNTATAISAVVDRYVQVVSAASAFGSAVPSLRISGEAQSTAGATGLAAVLRSVVAAASASAGATGYALPASDLGSVSATAGATAAQCIGHLIRPDSSFRVASATGVQAVATAIRGPKVLAHAGASGHADWRYKASGSTHYVWDGTVLAQNGSATCTATVLADHTAVISGIGGFDVGSSDALLANAHLIVWGKGFSNGVVSAGASATRVQPATVSAIARATASVTAKRTTFSGLRGTAGATSTLHPSLRLAGKVSANAGITAVAPKSRMLYAGSVLASAGSFANNPTTSNFFRVSAQGSAQATAVQAKYSTRQTAVVTAQATVQGHAAATARYQAAAQTAAQASVINASGAVRLAIHADATSQAVVSARAAASQRFAGAASAVAGSTATAMGLENIFVHAPDSRSMALEPQDRSMALDADDRVMYAS